jgi:hypothetical protein
MRCLASICFALAALCAASDAFAQTPNAASWAVPAPAEVKEQLDAWLATQSLSEEQKQALEALWPATDEARSGEELLDKLAASLAAVAPKAKEVVVFCQSPRSEVRLPEFEILADEKQPALVRNNLRLLYGVWLARHDMHEEALQQFADLTPQNVVDPVSLLFYRSVCHHRLRDKDACLPELATLLENEAAVPRRYREVAQLMQADLEPLKPDTLDEVARLMDSIRRRLKLARVGQRVRKEEDEVIAKLSKMIDELEKQRQEAEIQMSQGNPSGNPAPATPQSDSRAAGGRGKGDVDPKKLENHGNWGNLPPKERQEAMQQISKELPAHYREAVEEYFRKLARESD